MDDEAVILPAYVDEADERGLLRDLTPERDDNIGIRCARLSSDPTATLRPSRRLGQASINFVGPCLLARNSISLMRLSRATRPGE